MVMIKDNALGNCRQRLRIDRRIDYSQSHCAQAFLLEAKAHILGITRIRITDRRRCKKYSS
jgi:hypothetical protein